MRDHLDGEVTLDGLAAQAHLSKFHFLRAFRAATGTTPHRYLVRMRMQKAGQLLRTGRYTVAEVAQRCGYAGSGHFSAAFRRHTGVTPDRYRHM